MVHWKDENDNQEVSVFDQIPVKVELNMKRSPPDVRVISVNPGGNPIEPYQPDVGGGLDQLCLAILDENN